MASKYYREKHHRRSIRLKDYDYSHPGDYFITICTKNNALCQVAHPGDILKTKL